MPKYEYLTKKDLNYKQNAFEQAKFAYSPLNDKLKHDLVKYLEKSLFGEDIESIEPEEKYEESNQNR